jgi:SPP1 gp7 family putative phage head morphogenesis protein
LATNHAQTVAINIIYTDAYRTAFVEYLCRGTPIRLSLKQAAVTDRYVWRTRRDERVRLSHRMNDGRIFSWSERPDTGHPGEDYNCRCEAIPYVEGQTEFAFFDLASDTGSTGDRWENHDFVWHFFAGAGGGVMLSEIGHLREIIEQYAYQDGTEGAFRRLADQIADRARAGDFPYDFEAPYDFEGVEFSHGDATVRGQFGGTATVSGGMVHIEGVARFQFEDGFTDPVDLREFSAWLRSAPTGCGDCFRLWVVS